MPTVDGYSSNDYVSVLNENSDTVVVALGFVKNMGLSNSINVQYSYMTTSGDGYYDVVTILPPNQSCDFTTVSPALTSLNLSNFEIKIKSTLEEAHSDYTVKYKIVSD